MVIQFLVDMQDMSLVIVQVYNDQNDTKNFIYTLF